jgi:hypothetical protein
MEGHQQPQMLILQEEVLPQEDSREEDSQDGDHQVAEDHQAAEVHQEEVHQEEEVHQTHLPQSQCKEQTNLLEIHPTYSLGTGPSPRNLSRNGRCMKESTSLIT